jgi:SAM-dependent methyltransferase
MVSTPTWHTDFYQKELLNLAHSGDFNSILISGTADYSMLAHVLWAYEQHHREYHVTVLDLCETPLMLCKWYAKWISAGAGQVATVCADVLNFDLEKSVDLVATDAFLTRFPPHSRGHVVRRWNELLRPGGKVITTVRLESAPASHAIRASSAEVDAFQQRALGEAQRWQDFLGVVPEDIASRARRYAERMTSYSVSSVDELKSVFKSNFFHLERIDQMEVPGEMHGSVYARIVAVKQ